jgi:hypothetical protein
MGNWLLEKWSQHICDVCRRVLSIKNRKLHVYRNRGRNESTGSMTFDWHWKTHGVFEIYKIGLYLAGSVALSKHVTHCSPRSVFPYYNIYIYIYMLSYYIYIYIPPNRERPPYPPSGYALSNYVGFELSIEKI